MGEEPTSPPGALSRGYCSPSREDVSTVLDQTGLGLFPRRAEGTTWAPGPCPDDLFDFLGLLFPPSLDGWILKGWWASQHQAAVAGVSRGLVVKESSQWFSSGLHMLSISS